MLSTFLFFFEIQYLFVNFILEENRFLPFITIDHHHNNNCLWLVKKKEKTNEEKLDSYKKMNSRNEQSTHYALRPQGDLGSVITE